MPRLTRLSRSVEGKTVLVTGAASGMGRATAHLFADEGARVAVTDLQHEGVQSVVDEICGAGGTAHGWTMDVRDDARIATVVGEIVARFGALDIVVNNAGISRFSPIDAPDYGEKWALSIDVLLTGQTRVIRAALPHLRRAPDPRIVNIASTEAFGATRHGSPYTAAKHGVIGLTRSAAVELAADGVTVNCVCPGPIRTGMTAIIPEEHKERFARRRVPARRYGEPEEVADVIVSLVLPSASYITGAVVTVDGGLTVQNT